MRWFFHLWCASSWTPKTVRPPRRLYQIHELILEDRRISAKAIAEHLGISCERVGPFSHEDLDMWNLSAKWVPKCWNADQKRQWCQWSEQLLEFFQRHPNYFLSWLVTMDESWLYNYDPETKQQSMEWRHIGSPRPKKFRVNNPLEEFSPWFFGIKTVSSSLIIFHRAKLSTRNIAHLCWCSWRTFWRKNPVGSSPRDLVLARQCPSSPGSCNPEETALRVIPVSWSTTLFSGSGPVGLPTVHWTEKKTI